VAALDELKNEWPELRSVLASADDNPAEATLELRLAPSSLNRATLKTLSAEIARFPGVVAVDFGERDLLKIEVALSGLRTVALVLGLLLAMASLFVIGSTIRLAMRERRDEMDIMRLCGATDRFIRTPLCMEGTIQGSIGGVLALCVVVALDGVLSHVAGELLGRARELSELSPIPLALLFVGGGAALGLLGSALVTRNPSSA
jgi:cell division transport system permease protein